MLGVPIRDIKKLQEFYMAHTAEDIQKLYIAYLNRPADPNGLTYWMAQGLTLNQIADCFSKHTEYATVFAGKTTEETVNTMVSDAKQCLARYLTDSLRISPRSRGVSIPYCASTTTCCECLIQWWLASWQLCRWNTGRIGSKSW
jgi:hypothetical protein